MRGILKTLSSSATKEQVRGPCLQKQVKIAQRLLLHLLNRQRQQVLQQAQVYKPSLLRSDHPLGAECNSTTVLPEMERCDIQEMVLLGKAQLLDQKKKKEVSLRFPWLSWYSKDSYIFCSQFTEEARVVIAKQQKGQHKEADRLMEIALCHWEIPSPLVNTHTQAIKQQK